MQIKNSNSLDGCIACHDSKRVFLDDASRNGSPFIEQDISRAFYHERRQILLMLINPRTTRSWKKPSCFETRGRRFPRNR